MSTSPIVASRKMVYAAIKAKQDELLRKFVLEEHPLPVRWELLANLADKSVIGADTRVGVYGMGHTETKLTRAATAQIDVPVQVVVTAPIKVDPKGDLCNEDADELLNFCWQLIRICRKVGWKCTETQCKYMFAELSMPVDESGFPFSYVFFRENNVFQAYLSPLYRGSD